MDTNWTLGWIRVTLKCLLQISCRRDSCFEMHEEHNWRRTDRMQHCVDWTKLQLSIGEWTGKWTEEWIYQKFESISLKNAYGNSMKIYWKITISFKLAALKMLLSLSILNATRLKFMEFWKRFLKHLYGCEVDDATSKELHFKLGHMAFRLAKPTSCLLVLK